MAQIRIDSILGGHAPMRYFAGKDQFLTSLGIDPSLPAELPTFATYGGLSSGLLRPTPMTWTSIPSTIPHVPLWIRANPKDLNLYVYDFSGSVTAITSYGQASISDAGAMSSSSGNGAEYYDNYMYFAKNTDIARYGPLDGVPKFDPTYWTVTLSKAALTNTTYPRNWYLRFAHLNDIYYPNHVMHRHSDGKLYIADVVGNQGTIHFISTTKVTVEGDTDNGSTANKLQFGYGLWPTAMESYGQQMVIALFESKALSNGTNMPIAGARAKVAFWDTTSQNFNNITWVEYPDSFISAIKNVDGILYFISGNADTFGFRVMRYVGGNTFEEVVAFSDQPTPFAGAVDGQSNQLLFGSFTNHPEAGGVVYSLGLPNKISKGVFAIMRTDSADASVTAVSLDMLQYYSGVRPIAVGYSNGIGGAGSLTNNQVSYRYFTADVTFDNAPEVWWSQIYKIGEPFSVKKIQLNIASQSGISTNQLCTPKLYFDDGKTTLTLPAISTANYPVGTKAISIRVPNGVGQSNFWLELRWTGSKSLTFGFPILIDVEVTPQENG